jgi:NodT family efflux transporter outer membrane factor (OMF) lipoprotein
MLFLTACSTVEHKSLNNTVDNSSQPWNGPKWWESFNDPLINRFANQILAQNLDIKIAATRLAEARASTRVIASSLYPDVSGTGSEVRQKNIIYPIPETIGQAGLDVNWELDIFGQVRAGIRSSEARAKSLDATIDDVRNLVVADLVKAVIDWRQAQETIQKINTLLSSEDVTASLLDDRAKAGLIDASFVERAKAERAQTATQLPQAEGESKAAQYQVERLLGVKDESVAEALKAAEILPLELPSPELATAVSLSTIKNRPDVRAARFNLLASQADLDQAEDNLWPQLSVSGFFGVENAHPEGLVSSNPVWTLASSLTAPILNFGRLNGAVDAANAKTKGEEYKYENITLLALQETKTALSDYLYGINTLSVQTEALNRRQETVDIAKERFRLGLTDMTDLTTAQTELDQATLMLIADKTSTAEAYIRLEKALGLSGNRESKQ